MLLEARQINVRYGRGPLAVSAVEGVDVRIDAGQAIGIVGESGSGKSTLGRVLAGIQRPASGRVLLREVSVAGPGRRDLLTRKDRWRIQMVFQDPYSSLNPRMRALDAVAEAVGVWHHLPAPAARDRATELLYAVGISESQSRSRPEALSGGQRQRVSIARALAPDPEILVADEPTSAIDLSAQAQLLNLLRGLQASRGLAIVFVSHNLAAVRYLASHVYVMQDGRVVEEGVTELVLKTPHDPYTQQLVEAATPSRT